LSDNPGASLRNKYCRCPRHNFKPLRAYRSSLCEAIAVVSLPYSFRVHAQGKAHIVDAGASFSVERGR
jgi:hypothetical protein